MANGSPNLMAKLSRGFTMGWIGFALQSVPLICALMKIHATTQRKSQDVEAAKGAKEAGS